MTNPLGVGSYVDEYIPYDRVGPLANGETYALPVSGRSSIWRTPSGIAVTLWQEASLQCWSLDHGHRETVHLDEKRALLTFGRSSE